MLEPASFGPAALAGPHIERDEFMARSQVDRRSSLLALPGRNNSWIVFALRRSRKRTFYTNPHIEAPTVAHSRRATDMIFQG